MISIIVCSINHEYFEALSANIQRTIDLPYELIRIDNAVHKLSISEAYNRGGQLANFENLLFLHEDILFHSEAWGEKLIDLLQNRDTGIVGISGAIYKSHYPSSWSMIPREYYRVSAIQRWNNGSKTESLIRDDETRDYSQVAIIDGVFLAMKKQIWKDYLFDENNLEGFHFYDLDICLRVRQKYKLLVLHTILIEHFSEGNLDRSWVLQAISQHKRLKSLLEAGFGSIKKGLKKELDYSALSSFLFKMAQHRVFNLFFLGNLMKILFKYPQEKASWDILKYSLKKSI